MSEEREFCCTVFCETTRQNEQNQTEAEPSLLSSIAISSFFVVPSARSAALSRVRSSHPTVFYRRRYRSDARSKMTQCQRRQTNAITELAITVHAVSPALLRNVYAVDVYCLQKRKHVHKLISGVGHRSPVRKLHLHPQPDT